MDIVIFLIFKRKTQNNIFVRLKNTKELITNWKLTRLVKIEKDCDRLQKKKEKKKWDVNTVKKMLYSPEKNFLEVKCEYVVVTICNKERRSNYRNG